MFRVRVALGVILALLIAGGSLLAALPQAQLPRPEEVVKPRVYVSHAPVPRGQTFEIAVVGEIKPGFHINGNKPLEEYLIPTTVEPQLPAGFKLLSASYPQAKLQKFPFSENKLAVYDGTFVVRLKLQAASDAPLGSSKLPLTLRYQACNDELCLPPVKIPLTAQLEIAAPGAKAKLQHADIFSSKP
jgi:hypothetical protein